MLNAWTRELGTKQGRIAPAGVAPLQGISVFCIGFDGAGHTDHLNLGDFADVSQTATFQTSTRIFRMSAVVRPPRTAPTGTQWRLSLRIDDVEVVAQILKPGGKTRVRHFAANVSKINDGFDHKVALRLALEAA